MGILSLSLDLERQERAFRTLVTRRIALSILAVQLVFLPIRFIFFEAKPHYLISNAVTIACLALSLFFLRFPHREHWASASLLIGLSALGALSALFNAGVRAPVVVVFIVLPLIGMLTASKRGGITGLALTLICVPSLLWAEKMGWVMPMDPGASGYVAVMFCSIAIACYAIGAAYERSRKQAERRLLELSQTIAAQSKLSSLGEMASGVAHEINNPLAIVSVKAAHALRRLQEGGAPAAELQADLEKIIQTSERIARIVRGLRTFSRSADNDPMSLASLPLVIEEALDMCSERFRHHAIELRVANIPDLTLLCRPSQIAQVIVNLLNNAFDAVEALPEKWAELGFEIDSDTSRVRISVTDSGSGIPEEIARKMMQPFFTTKAVGRGTGLGLSISQSLVAGHGGTLVYTLAGGHTRFTFDIAYQGERSQNARTSSTIA